MKPRLAEILGVEVNEEFHVEGFRYRINKDGRREGFEEHWQVMIGDSRLADIINNPSLIIRKKKFSPDEIAMMREFVQTGCQWLTRDENAELTIYKEIPCKRFSMWDIPGTSYYELPSSLFPQIKWEDAEPFDMKAFLESEDKMLEHFGFPCDIDEDEPLMKCPRCGEEIYQGDDVIRCDMTEEIVGCGSCLSTETLYKEE